jgi:hypothetical protein
MTVKQERDAILIAIRDGLIGAEEAADLLKKAKERRDQWTEDNR